MRRLISIAAAALAVPQPAHAAPVIVGTSCGMVVVDVSTLVAQDDVFVGVIYGAVATADADPPSTNPVPLSVRCLLYADGHLQRTVRSAGDEAATVLFSPIKLIAEEGGNVRLCTEIAAGPTSWAGCADATRTQLPPQEVCDLLPPPCPMTDETTLDVLVVEPQPVVG